MEPQNVEEYKGLRNEIKELKSCITTYIGFVLIGVAPAFWELTKAVPSRPNFPMAFLGPMVALGLKLVLLLLLYKCHSHNRYCGYCKLLEQEVFDHKGNQSIPVFLWEVCLDRLRWSDDAENGLAKYLTHYRGKRPTEEQVKDRVKRYSGLTPEADKDRFKDGWKLLLPSQRILHTEVETRGTWHYPLYIAKLFAFIDVGFLILGFILLIPQDLHAGYILHDYSYISVVVLWILCVGLLFRVWSRLLGRLYRQMLGSHTVDAFCWKFVPIRDRLLRNLKIINEYELSCLDLGEDIHIRKDAA